MSEPLCLLRLPTRLGFGFRVEGNFLQIHELKVSVALSVGWGHDVGSRGRSTRNPETLNPKTLKP